MELEKLKKVIAEVLSVDPEEITMDTTFIDDLGADSLDTIELVMALEQAFNTDIPDEEAEQLTTVGDAISYVEKKIGTGE